MGRSGVLQLRAEDTMNIEATGLYFLRPSSSTSFPHLGSLKTSVTWSPNLLRVLPMSEFEILSLPMVYFAECVLPFTKQKKITYWGKEKAVEEQAPMIWENLILPETIWASKHNMTAAGKGREWSCLPWNGMKCLKLILSQEVLLLLLDFRIIREKLCVLIGRTCTLASWCLKF